MLVAASSGARAASDVALHLVVDGRSVDSRMAAGVLHDGIAYVDVVDGVHAIGGLLSFGNRGSFRVSKSGRTLGFAVGRPTATLESTNVRLPGVPFVREHETYVPLAALASLAETKLTIDTRGHRALLALGRGEGYPFETRHFSESDEIAPSPTQALRFATSATTDATGLSARVEISNTTARPYVLSFPSARQIGFVLARNGSEVWSSLANVPGTEPSKVTIPARGTIVVTRTYPAFDRLGPGRYLMRVRLATLIPIDITPISLGEVGASPSPTR